MAERPIEGSERDVPSNVIAQLVDLLPGSRNRDLFESILDDCVGLAADQCDRGNLKLIARAVHEMRATFAAFAPYAETRKVTVFGSARTQTNDPLYETAVRIASLFAAEGWIVVTGAGPGIMRACVEGAGPQASLGVAIDLPWESVSPNDDDPRVVMARQLFTRKLGLVKEASALVCMPGGFGTLDEIFEVLTLVTRGKGQLAPIYLVETPDTSFWSPLLTFLESDVAGRGYLDPSEVRVLRHMSDVESVVADAHHFYSNYDSMRYLGPDLLLRVRRHPQPALIERIRSEFDDVLRSPRIGILTPRDHSRLLGDHLFGIRLEFDRHSFARLYELVAYLNASELTELVQAPENKYP